MSPSHPTPDTTCHPPPNREVNNSGLEGLYEILIDGSKFEWVAALQRILAAAEKGQPLLFFCKAGKDRTVRVIGGRGGGGGVGGAGGGGSNGVLPAACQYAKLPSMYAAAQPAK